MVMMAQNSVERPLAFDTGAYAKEFTDNLKDKCFSTSFLVPL